MRRRRGEEVILARDGDVVAQVVQWPADRRDRRPGAWRGRVRYLDGHDPVPSDPDVAALFTASTERP